MLATRADGPVAASKARDGRVLVIAVLLLAGAAWALLVARHGLPDLGVPAGCGGHHGAGHTAITDPACVEVTAPAPRPGVSDVNASLVLDTLTGWVVMVVAMMLPPALPLLTVVRRLVARHSRPWLLLGCAALAFVGVWAAAGVLLVAVDALVAAADPAVLRENPQVVSGLAAVAAGVYQFTPLKRACLTACRSPWGIAATTWTGLRPPAVSTAQIGARFGLVCVGCCWALMLLTLAVGIAALPLMVAASLLMALERLAPRTRDLVPLLGAVAVVLGLLILLGVLPPGLPVLKGHH